MTIFRSTMIQTETGKTDMNQHQPIYKSNTGPLTSWWPGWRL